MLSSPSDDEVGGIQGAIRAERAKRVEQLNTERAKRVGQLNTEYAVAGDRGLS
jgi:hypothetical protein